LFWIHPEFITACLPKEQRQTFEDGEKNPE
jgi:hypothetical protein